MALGVFLCSLVCVEERVRGREGGRESERAGWPTSYTAIRCLIRAVGRHGDDYKNSIIFLSN